ncbi:MAG: Bax inhibitor-1/YccA family protein, partial [Saprospiraceae bacterium]
MFKKFNTGGNPFFKSVVTSSPPPVPYTTERLESMTIQGAINKTLILFGILLITGIYNYQLQNTLLMIGGAIAGL